MAPDEDDEEENENDNGGGDEDDDADDDSGFLGRKGFWKPEILLLPVGNVFLPFSSLLPLWQLTLLTMWFLLFLSLQSLLLLQKLLVSLLPSGLFFIPLPLL